jgi:deoxyribodipyrimidine photo-lyase
MQTPVSIFWFRRDLRLDDNAGLYHALKGQHPVLPVFIFDRNILDDLPERNDARVTFIHRCLAELRSQLEALGSTLLVAFGKPEEIWPQLIAQIPVAAVYTNRDYEPYALQRDEFVKNLLNQHGIAWRTFKDHVIFEKDEVLKTDGTPYTVFTPYSRKWREKLPTRRQILPNEPGETSFFFRSYPTLQYAGHFLKRSETPQAIIDAYPLPTLETLGFVPSNLPFPTPVVARSLIRNYDKTRDFPALAGTSRLGVHFRFGTISIREKARHAASLNETYLNELIWRDFYSQILAHFPRVVGHAFRPEYDRIAWRNAPEDLEKWKKGQTGYPLVDAGMRELNATGYMHNRVRMVVASFFSKHLLLDWRLGEAYFAQKLLDFDLASNSGGWQWAAGCGTDAAPYFRIFNPTEQARKFDPESRYIRRWVPEFGTPAYPRPMVEHTFARERCLKVYQVALKGG